MKKNKLVLIFLTVVLMSFFYLVTRYASYNYNSVYLYNDFYDYYIGSKLFWSGQYPYGVTEEFIKLVQKYHLRFVWATGYSYPPFLAFIFYPLTLLTPYLAAEIWFYINLAIYSIFAYKLAIKSKSSKLSVITIIYILTFLPAIYTMASGQVMIFILIGLYWYFYSKSNLKVIIGISFASLIKVYPILFFIKDFLFKRYRMIIKSILLISISLLIVGFFSKISYNFDFFLRELPELNNSFEPHFTHQALNSVLSRAFISIDKTRPIIDYQFISFFNILISLVVIIIAVFYTLKHKRQKTLVSFLWLCILSIIPGKNTFWSFVPCLFIGLYLINNWSKINNLSRILFVIATLISNFLWHFVYFFEKDIYPTNIFTRSIYVVLSSLGFIYICLLAVIIIYTLKIANQKKI